MTTIIPYQQTTQGPFQFEPVLDGQTYSATTPWGLFGKRLFLSLSALDGTEVVYEALVGSPTAINVQSLSWLANTATLTCDTPHGFRIGNTVELTVSGCTPTAYNGVFQMLAINTTSLTYSLPGPLDDGSQLGTVSYDIDLIAGYGFTSTMVFRAASQQFEINP